MFRRLSSFSIFLVCVLLFLLPQSVYAASITITNASPQTLTSADSEYQADISLSIHASDGTTYYIGGVFSVQGTTNYCGVTWNAEKSSWVSYTDEANLPAVMVASSAAATTIKARLDTQDSGCQTAGTYTFKVRRYTEGGSASFDEQNEQTVVVALPTSTPTPSRTPSPTPTAKPNPTATPPPLSKTASSPAVTPNDTTLSKSKTSAQLNLGGTVTTDRNEATVFFTPAEKSVQVLVSGETGQATQSTNVLGVADNPSRGVNLIVGLIAAGGACVGSAGYLMIRARRTR